MVSTSPNGGERVRATSDTKGRLRLIVVQALVLALFVTLFARLWYLQVLSGEAYQAQAAEQSIRELVVQPAVDHFAIIMSMAEPEAPIVSAIRAQMGLTGPPA